MSAGMAGADPRALREMAGRFDAGAQELMGVRGSVQVWVDMTNIWLGLNYHLFKDMWETTGAKNIVDAASILHHCADVLRANADAQDATSAADGGVAGSGSFSGLFGGGSAGSGSPRSPRSTADLLGQGGAGGNDDGDGIRIQKIRGEDGTERFIVHIRGMDMWDPVGRHSHWTNAQLVTGFGGEATDYVEQKMREAGIGKGDEILFVGHSQGGAVGEILHEKRGYSNSYVINEGGPAVPGGSGDRVLRLQGYSGADGGIQAVGGFLSTVHDLASGSSPMASDGVVHRVGHDGNPWGFFNLESHSGHEEFKVAARQFDARTDAEAVRFREGLARFQDCRIVEDTDN
jgi:hypothetical protein